MTQHTVTVESSPEILIDLDKKKPLRVLHVDDEPSLLKIAKQCLELQGPFHVDSASSVEEALERLKRETYDAVVSDYQMPGKDGLEFLKELRQGGNYIPFVMFTGKGREGIAIKALNLGADQYLNKIGDPETVYCELGYAIRRTLEKRKAQIALETLGERYRRLFESAVEGVLINGSDGKILSLNQAAANILGYSNPEELVGKSAVELYADSEARTLVLQELMKHGSVKDYEMTWKKKDGKLIEILASVNVQKDEKGDLLRTEGIIRDITEKKKAEKALKESEEKNRILAARALEGEEKFRNLAEQSPNMIFINKQGRVVYANKRAEEVMGYIREEFYSPDFNFLTLIAPDSRELLKSDFAKHMKGEDVSPFEYKLVTKQGKVFDAMQSSKLIDYEGERAILGTVTDITERKKLECKLFDEQMRLQSIFDTTPNSIVVIDLNGKIVDINDQAQRILGYPSKSESIGRSAFESISEKDRQRAMENMEKTLTQGLMRNVEYTIITKDGNERPLSVSASVLKDLSGNPTGFVSVIEDITERKRVEESLKESDEKFRTLFNEAIDAIFVADAETGIIVDCNRAAMELVDRTKQELIGKHQRILHPETETKDGTFGNTFQEHIGEREGQILETQVITKNGEIKEVAIKGNIIELRGRKVLQGIFRNISEHKKALEELRESVERFRDLFESIQDPVGIFVGREGRLTDCNPAFKRLSGYTDEELKDKAFLDFVHPDDHSLVLEKYKTKYSEKELPLVYEIRGMNKKGESIPLEISVSTYKKKDRIIGIEVIHRDITERKKLEEKLRESEERLRNLYESVPDSLAVYVGREGHILEYNKAFKRLSGYTDEELKDKAFLDFVHPDDRVLVLERYHTEYLEEELPLIYEIRTVNKKGESIPTEISVGTYKKKGNIIGINVMHRDITDRKKAERAILENQENFKALFAGNPEAAVHVGSDFCILDVNSRFEMLFGYKLDEIKGRNINDVVVPKDKIDEAHMLDCRARQDKHISQATVRRKKDGSLVPVFVSAASISVEGRYLGYVAVYKDISELKNTEKKLEIMNEKLRVTGGLTRHDVRNKLSAIAGNAYLLKKQLAGDSSALDKLRDMEVAVEQAVRIFDFAKTYEMLGAEELVYVDVEKAVNEAISLFSGLKDVTVIDDCHGLSVLADSLLNQLFYNLIDNSLKYGQKTTKIRVHYGQSDQEELRLVYEDDGIGINKAEKLKLFKEGYSTGGSTGYGLYLIKKMIEVYEWTIQETGTPGKGVQFTITIPKTNRNGKENYQLRNL